MDLADLFLEPYKTRATAAELLTEIRFPVLPPRSGSAFVKLGRRNALSISRLSVAAVLTFSQDGVIAGARIVPGAAFPVWRRAIRAENVLVGERPSPQLFSGAGAAVSTMMLELTGRRWSTPYKEPVIGVLVKRALELCRDSAFAPERATTGVGVRN
jgi:carbon-monoxide dehydrogenase medium subunit/xanthine dehydrogenase FAD-binding subunit